MKINRNINDRSVTATVFPEEILEKADRIIFEEVCKNIAKEVSVIFIHEHLQEVLAKIDPQAIANLVVAESGNAIKDMLDKKLPDRVDTIIKNNVQVYQRGVFGGITKIR